MIDLTQHIFARGLDIFKSDLGRITRVDHVGFVAGDACAVSRNVEQGQPVCGARQHQQTVSHRAIDHECLFAVQAKAIAVGLGLHRAGVRIVLDALVHGERIGHIAAGDPRQRFFGACIANLTQGGRRNHSS